MAVYEGGLAEQIVREGKLVGHLVHNPRKLGESEIADFRERVIDKITHEFGDSVEVQHLDKTVNGVRIYIDSQSQAKQVSYVVRELSFVHNAYVSLMKPNCIVVLFETDPRLECGSFVLKILGLLVLAAILCFVLSVVNPDYTIPVVGEVEWIGGLSAAAEM